VGQSPAQLRDLPGAEARGDGVPQRIGLRDGQTGDGGSAADCPLAAHLGTQVQPLLHHPPGW